MLFSITYQVLADIFVCVLVVIKTCSAQMKYSNKNKKTLWL